MGNGFFIQNTSQQYFLRLYYCLFFRDMSLNSQECYLVLRHISFNIQWTFIYLLCFFEPSNLYLFHVIVIWAIQSNYMLFSFLFLFAVTNLFLLLRFLTLFNQTVACAYRLGYCCLHYRIMFSVLKYLDISCCWM